MEAKKQATEEYDQKLADVTATIREQKAATDESLDTWETYVNAVSKTDLSSMATVSNKGSVDQ
jgi:hypothetical protein